MTVEILCHEMVALTVFLFAATHLSRMYLYDAPETLPVCIIDVFHCDFVWVISHQCRERRDC